MAENQFEEFDAKMDVLFTINKDGVLENTEFDDTAGLNIDPDFEEIVDYIHKTAVVIPSGVTRIGDKAFYDKRWLTGVTIPDSTVSIGDSAFSDCYYMENIVIPENVAIIGNKAFVYCEALAGVTIMNETVVIANDAFLGCGENLTIYAKSGSSAEKYAAENSLRFEAI